MIKNATKLKKFERSLIIKKKLSYREALKVYETMHREAVRLGIINSKNILDGIEVDIRIAKALNSLK